MLNVTVAALLIAFTAPYATTESITTERSQRIGKKSRNTSRQPRPDAPPLPVGKCGTLTGRFVVEGHVPTQRVALPIAGRPAVVRQPIVDPRTKALRLAAVYLRDPSSLPPLFQNRPRPGRTAKVALKNGQFSPQFLFARPGQTIDLKNEDRVAYNPLVNTIFNRSENQFLRPGATIRLQFPKPEKIPCDVRCAVHPYIQGWWFIVDHPFHDSTEIDGQFTITDLPPGKHEFRSWHPYCGWVEKSLNVDIEAGKVTDLGDIAVPVSKLFPR